MTPMKKYWRLYQGIIIPVLTILCIVIGTIFGIIPAVNRIIGIRSEASELSELLVDLRQKATVLDDIDENLYKKYLTELATAVPPDKSLTTVFSTIDGLGELSGATLSDFTVSKPGILATASASKATTEEKIVGSSLLPFTLTVAGTYDQIHQFLSQVNLVRRFFRVRFFDIQFVSAEQISARLGMDAFYAQLPNRLGSTEQKIESLTRDDEATIIQVSSLPVLSQEPTIGTPVDSLNHDDPFSP